MGNGMGSTSIYGARFEDERLWLPHSTKGLLTTAISGPSSNNSQFAITFRPAPKLTGKHTVFGRVLKGLDELYIVCKKIESGAQDKPLTEIEIVGCGELLDDKVGQEEGEKICAELEVNDDQS